MWLPTPYTLGIRRYSEGAMDAHGNPVVSWDAATAWLVHGYASGASDEPDQRNRDLSMVLWTVYAPVAGAPGYLDLVVLEGVEYAVEGSPRDYTHNPWGFEVGGAVVYLKAVDG